MSDQAKKDTIDSLSKYELQEEVNKGLQSRFSRGCHAYMKTRLQELEDKETADNRSEDLSLQKDSNRIAEEANKISRGASCLSKWALGFAVIAILISFLNWMFP